MNLFIYLFMFGCVGSSLLRAGFSLVVVSGGYSSFRCAGFSLRWLLSLYFFKINLFILFIYFWLRWVFVAACGFSLVAFSAGYSPLWCADFSLRWLLLLRSTGSRCTGFSSCGT